MAQATANPAAVANGDLVVFTAASSETCSQTPMAWTWSGPDSLADDLTISIGVQPITLSSRMVHRRAGTTPLTKRAVQVYTKVAGGVPITQSMFNWEANVQPGTYRYVVSIEGAGVVSFSDNFRVVAGSDTSCLNGGAVLSSSSSVTDPTSTAAIPRASSTLASIARDPSTTAASPASSSAAPTSSSSSSTAVITPTTAPPAAPAASAASPPSASSHTNSGAIAAGVVVPLLAVAALLLFFLYRRRRRTTTEDSSWDEKYGPGGRARASRMTALDMGAPGHAHARSLSGPASVDGIKVAEGDFYAVGFEDSEQGHGRGVDGSEQGHGAGHQLESAPPYSNSDGAAEVLRESSGSRYRRLLLPSTMEARDETSRQLARDEAARKLALTSRFSDTTAGGSSVAGLGRSLSTSSAVPPSARNVKPLNRSASSGSTTGIRRKPVKYSLSIVGDEGGEVPPIPSASDQAKSAPGANATANETADAYGGIDDGEADFIIPITDTAPAAKTLQLPSPVGEEMGASNRSSKDPYSPQPEWVEGFASLQENLGGASKRDDSASPFDDVNSVTPGDASATAASSPELESLAFPRPAFLNDAPAGSRSSATSVSLPYIGEGGAVRPPSYAGSERFPRSVRSGVDSFVGNAPMGRSTPAKRSSGSADAAAKKESPQEYKLDLDVDRSSFRLSF